MPNNMLGLGGLREQAYPGAGQQVPGQPMGRGMPQMQPQGQPMSGQQPTQVPMQAQQPMTMWHALEQMIFEEEMSSDEW